MGGRPGSPLAAGAGDDLLGQRAGQLVESLEVGEIFSEGGHFCRRDTPAEISPALPGLELEVWAKENGFGAIGRGLGSKLFGELAAFHGGDGSDLIEEGLGCRMLVGLHLMSILLDIVWGK